ncbi:phenylalanine--tRNA ligase subunit beta [Patescibacteria group bacterium]
MKLSVGWLKQFVDVDYPISKIAEIFTSIGHEVESYNNSVLDMDITPNRGDCLSVIGLAREFAVATNKKFKNPHMPKIKESSVSSLKVKFQNSSICPKYTHRIIENIKVQDSPKWIQDYLTEYGFRPINNIVDITNFVMIEYGQPLHAFDYSKISNSNINICLSKKGQNIITLDNKSHELPDNAIIIKDSEKIIDLAGIMGGYNTEIDNKTKSIVLQAAIFDQILIRQASKSLKHITDASYRYERGVDPENTTPAINRAVNLLLETCPKIKTGSIQEIINKPYPKIKIPLNINKVNNFLSTDLSSKQIYGILSSLGFEIVNNSAQVPSWRLYDVQNLQDIVEEIGRIYGYNKLKQIKLPLFTNSNKNQEYIFFEILKDQLVAQGYTETIGQPITTEENPNNIINPISKEDLYLRSELLESLLSIAGSNPWYPDIKIFEIGKVYLKETELYNLNILETNKSPKKIIENLKIIEKSLNIKLNYAQTEVTTKDLDKYKIKRPVTLMGVELPISSKSLDWSSVNISKNRVKYYKISKYAPSIRDLAFIVDKNTQAPPVASDIEKIENSDAKVIIVEKFDEFEHTKFGKNKKNLAFHIVVDPKKKITEKQINSIFKKIIDTITVKHQAKLREF